MVSRYAHNVENAGSTPAAATMTDKEKNILSNVAETIMEMPIGFQAGGRNFYMYPPSIGTAMLIERLLKDQIDETDAEGGLFKMLKAVRKNKMLVIKLAAICSFENRSDACKTHLLKEREDDIKGIKDDALMQLLLHFTAWNGDFEQFFAHFGLDKEQMYIKRCMEVKEKDDSSLTFNGKSMYGTLIDVACERYGWTMDYVIWGISINNLRMLMADHITSVFLTKKERQMAAIPKDRRVLNMDKMTKEEYLKLRKRK